MNMNYGGLVGLLGLVLLILALVDILKGSMDSNKKLLWVLVVILVPIIGPILYFILEKRTIKVE